MDLLNKQCLPSNWEEQWRREKERRKKSFEEGDDEMIKLDSRELKRIVEYNDAKMGLSSSEHQIFISGKIQEGFGGLANQKAVENKSHVATYHSTTHLCNIFSVFKALQESNVLTDLCLVTKNSESIVVHAPVLASVSSYIRMKLKDGASGQGSNDTDADVCPKTLRLGPEVEHAGLLAVVEFAYTGTAVSSFNKNSSDLIRATAQTLGVPQVVELCDRGVEGLLKKDLPIPEEEEVQTLEYIKTTLQSISQLWDDKVGCDITLDLEETSFHGRHVLLLKTSIYVFYRHYFNCPFFSFSQFTKLSWPLAVISFELCSLAG